MTIRIVTDSTCDLPADIVAAHGITVVPLYINIGAKSYLDGIDLTRQAFYAGLPGYQPFPTTAVPGAGQFAEVYNRLADEGATDIMSIHIAPSLSAVVNAARLGADMIKNARVTVIDSGQLSLGLGFMVQLAAQAAADGCSVAEIVALLDELRGRAYVFATLDTTEFLYRSGRVNGFQNGLGTLLQIKPILKMHNGKAESEKIRTSKMAARRLVELAQEIGPVERLALVHTDNRDGAQALWAQCSHLFPAVRDPIDVKVTPVIGAHIGPGAVGFACLRAPRG
ncbi:MAG: DegV family protein [Anaerolineae bacterium]|nr:DegV family protein [Anaerolineae bacterium]